MNVSITPITPGHAAYKVRVYPNGSGPAEVGGDPYVQAFIIEVGNDMIPEIQIVTEPVSKEIARAVKTWAILNGYKFWRRVWPDGRSVVRPLDE